MVHECCQRLYYSDFYALSLYKWHITLFYFGYSATWPKGVQRMADQYLKNPVRVFVGSLDLNVSTHKIIMYCFDLPWGKRYFVFQESVSGNIEIQGKQNNYLLPGLSLRFQAAECMVGRKLKSLEVFFWFCFQKIARGNPQPPSVLGGNCVLQFSFPRNQSLSDKAIKNFYVFKNISSSQHLWVLTSTVTLYPLTS